LLIVILRQVHKKTILHFFGPFSPSLASKFAKSANIFSKKSAWLSKNTKFFADIYSGKKMHKKSPLTSYYQTTDEEIESLYPMCTVNAQA